MRLKLLCLAIAGALVPPGPAVAEEQTLKFRVVMTKTGGTAMGVAGLKGRVLGAEKYAGVAVFDDGRIAFKRVVLTYDNTGETGKYHGFSTYEFQDGDVLVVGFEGAATPAGSGGDYQVAAGAGAYQGATGTGRFDAVENPWNDADMYEGTISVTLADR